jgi:hypothetical protein
MQIWTDFQRRQMASAQRRRIEEALEIGIRNG